MNRVVAESLIESLAAEFPIPHFVESCAGRDQWSDWATTRFASIATVRHVELVLDHCVSRHDSVGNRRDLLGDSAAALSLLAREMTGPAVFWLRSHAGPSEIGQGGSIELEAGLVSQRADGVPAGPLADESLGLLLAELDALRLSRFSPYVLVPGASRFLAPQSAAIDVADITRLLCASCADCCVMILGDVLVSVPPYARRVVQRHARDFQRC